MANITSAHGATLCQQITNASNIQNGSNEESLNEIFRILGESNHSFDINNQHSGKNALQTGVINDKTGEIIRHLVFEMLHNIDLSMCDVITDNAGIMTTCTQMWQLLFYVNIMVWNIYHTKLNNEEKQLFIRHLKPRLTINLNQLKVNGMKTLLHEFVKQFNTDCVNIILNYTKDPTFNINTLTKIDLKHVLHMCCDFDDTTDLFKNEDNLKEEIDMKRDIEYKLILTRKAAIEAQQVLSKYYEKIRKDVQQINKAAQQIRNKQTKFIQGLKQIENQKRQQMGSGVGGGMGSNQYSSNNYSNQTSGLIKKLDPISNTPVQNIQMPEVPIPPVVTETRVNSQYKTIRESQFTRSGDKSHIIVRTFKQRAKLMRLFRWIVNDSMNDNDDNNNFKSSGCNNHDNNGDRTTRIDMFLKTSNSHAGVYVETKSKRLFFSFPSTK